MKEKKVKKLLKKLRNFYNKWSDEDFELDKIYEYYSDDFEDAISFDSGEFTGLCDTIRLMYLKEIFSSQEEIFLRKYIYLYKPEKRHDGLFTNENVYWWKRNDVISRLNFLNKLIEEL